MLRGNYTARIDPKGRLKVPTPFRRLIEEKHGGEFYITSLTGENVRIYPLPEWESIEQRLSLLPTMDPARRKFLDRTNYYGQQATIDGQGRLLIHPLLRKSAAVVGDVAVMGYLTTSKFGSLISLSNACFQIPIRKKTKQRLRDWESENSDK